MRALTFNVSVPGFVKARTLGRLSESARYGALSNLRMRELPEPALRGPHWVGLRVIAAGICGTDLAALDYSASPALEPFGSFPAVLGHEVLAQVDAVGEAVSTVQPGQRVVVNPMVSCRVRGHPPEAACASCRAGRHSTCEMAGEEGASAGPPPEGPSLGPPPEGPSAGTPPWPATPGETEPDAPALGVPVRPLSHGLTIGYHTDLPGGWGERMVAHESQLFAVTPGLSTQAAVLVEPLAIGVHAVLNGGPRDPHHEVLVIGSGPIALGTIWALRATGFPGTIVAQTKRDHEGELALQMGADQVIKPGLEARQALVDTGARAYQPILGPEVFAGGGFPLVFDCVGNAGSLNQALRFAAPRGRVVLLGCAAKMSGLDLTFVWARELEVQGFVGYGREEWQGEPRHTFQVTMELLAETSAPVGELVTHAFPLDAYRHALSAAANHRRSGAVKVILEPA